MVAEAVAAMKPGRILISAQQRFIGSGEDRDSGPTEFHCIKSVTSGLLYRNISSNGRDRHHANIGRAKRHDEGNRVVGRGVGIDEERSGHAGRIT